MPSRFFSWKLIAVAVVGLAAAVAGFLWFKQHDYNVRLSIEDGIGVLRAMGPWPFFIAMALLPAVGCPMSVFYFTVGSAFSATMGMSGVLLASCAALTVNIALTYWLARYGLRPWLERMISKTRYKIPQLSAQDHTELTLIVRITPGSPFFVQSYLLGLAEVKFSTYLWISWVVTMAYAFGFIVFGDAILHGKARVAIMGLSALIAVTLIVHFLRRHYGKKNTAA